MKTPDSFKKPKPKPGSLPMYGDEPPRDEFEGVDPALKEAVLSARSAPPPWIGPDEEYVEPKPLAPERPEGANLKKLKAARNKVQEYAAVVRDDAFDDWIRRCVVTAARPDEWTQARELYESYLRQAPKYGQNRPAARLIKEGLATETQWGKLMGAQFTKVRRRNGMYYPLRLKQGA